MARINVDEKIFSDLRFLSLVTKVGNAELAMGRLIFFWSAAQRSYAHGSEIKRSDFRDEWRVLIECGFAEERENGFYAKGSEEQFSWLKQKVTAGKSGGIKSVEAKRSGGKRSKAKASAANPLPLTLSPTLTPALADITGGVPPEPKTPGSRVWQAYAVAYQQAYRTEPTPNARNYALASQLVKRLGEEDAVKVVRFYLTHRKRWYIDKVHDLAPCIADAEGLRTQMVKDHRVSSADAAELDKSQANEQTFARVAAKLEAERAEKEAQGGSQP